MAIPVPAITQGQPASGGVALTIIPDLGNPRHPVFERSVDAVSPRPPLKTGPLSNEANRVIAICNTSEVRLRLCFQQIEGVPIAACLETPFNSDLDISTGSLRSPARGWVEIAPLAQFKIILRDLPAAPDVSRKLMFRFTPLDELPPMAPCPDLEEQPRENQEEVISP